MTYIVDCPTPSQPHEVAREVLSALDVLGHGVPSAQALACLLGQSAAETGHWRADTFRCFCAGNERASRRYEGLVTYRGCNERISGRLVWYHPPARFGWPGRREWLAARRRAGAGASVESEDGSRFRAYLTLGDGVRAWVTLMHEQFGVALRVALLSGDPEAFVAALYRRGYFTANLEHYQRMVRSTTKRYAATARGALAAGASTRSTAAPPPVDAETLELRNLVELTPEWDDMRRERRARVLESD